MSMRNYRYFALFLLVTAIWTFAFGSAKYFLWALWKDSLGITLETVAGYLAAGGAAAYFVGGYAVKRFGVRDSLTVAGFIGLGTAAWLWCQGNPSVAGLSATLGVFGFAYGVWVVGRSVLISTEIRRTGLPDTAVTGAVNVAFIVSVILGSVLGGKIAETLGTAGHAVLAATVGAALAGSRLFLHADFDADPSCEMREAVSGFARWKAVFVRHGKLLGPTVALWSLSTVASQQVIQSSVSFFGKSPSEAAMVLLYSSVGAIVGNALSTKMAERRWKWFHAGNLAFVASLAAIPPVFHFAKSAGTYAPVVAIAVFIGLCFSVAANLAEGHYFRVIERENEKEFGSSLYGIALSAALALTMAAVGVMAARLPWESVFFALATASSLLCIPVRSYAGNEGRGDGKGA